MICTNSEGTPLSIPTTGIKHSMSCSYKLLVNEQESVLLPQVCDHSTIDAIYLDIG